MAKDSPAARTSNSQAKAPETGSKSLLNARLTSEGRDIGNWLLTGLRGVGKTVLLNEMERIAQGEGFRTILVEAHEKKPFADRGIHHPTP
ncbi:MAG TPA: hypothetical protein VGB18_03460 [Candidatus Thermoplasmatota archaeon]